MGFYGPFGLPGTNPMRMVFIPQYHAVVAQKIRFGRTWHT